MNTVIIGIGGIAVSNMPTDLLKTLALGSCVGLTFYSAKIKVAGLIHIALPESKTNPELAIERPGYYADTGIPLILKEMQKLGCSPSDFVIKIMGGANIMDPDNRFDIGTRNVLAVKKLLWRFRLGAIAEDVGGTVGRTVSISVETGKVLISSAGVGEWEL